MVALCDSSRKVLAVSADDGAAAWAANTAKTLTVGPYVTPSAGFYYLAVMVAATTVPTLIGMASSGVPNGLVPILGGNSSTVAQTTPPAVGSTFGAIGASSVTLYGYVG